MVCDCIDIYVRILLLNGGGDFVDEPEFGIGLRAKPFSKLFAIIALADAIAMRVVLGDRDGVCRGTFCDTLQADPDEFAGHLIIAETELVVLDMIASLSSDKGIPFWMLGIVFRGRQKLSEGMDLTDDVAMVSVFWLKE